MKKLLILLIFSFFSLPSYAGSCPDGSDPVKSISADGTYFVYNCAGSSNDASSSTNSSTSSSTVSSKNTSKGDVIKEEKTEKEIIEIIELNTENTQTIEIAIPKNSRTWDYPFLVFDNYEAKVQMIIINFNQI